MKLSAKERTGLRAMVELARHHGEGPTALSEIARAQQLPLPYLERVVGSLRRAGLLNSVRGSHGGYELASDPQAISISDVFTSLEGTLLSVDCLCPDGSGCDREPTCAAKDVIESLRQCLDETLGSMTLADVVGAHHE